MSISEKPSLSTLRCRHSEPELSSNEHPMLSAELVSICSYSQSRVIKGQLALTAALNCVWWCWQVSGGGSAVAAHGPALGGSGGIQPLCLSCTMHHDHGMCSEPIYMRMHL